MAIIASILTIITVVSCLMMFFIKREQKAALLIMGTMILTLVNVPYVPLHKANFLLPAFFLLSEWKSLTFHIKRIWNMPSLRFAFIILFISTAVCAFTTTYTKPWSIIQGELIFKYFALAYAFMAVKDERSLKPVLRISIYCLIALTFFGILNYINRSADLVNELTKGQTSWIYNVEWGNYYSERGRFRVQSMFKSPFDYGYICAAVLMLHIHAWYQKLESKDSFLIAVMCCAFGIITCGCRTVWVCSLFSVICYYLWSFKLGRNMILGIVGVILFVLSYSFIPVVEEKVNSLTDVFVEDSETGGSSIAMRTTQFAMTLYYVEGYEFLGRGKGFFTSEIWNPDVDQRKRNETGLAGMESVIMGYILERGYFGLTLWITFYFIIFLYFRRHKQNNKLLTGLGVSILSLYMVFAIATGELGSVYPTLLLLGMTMKMLEYNQRRTMLFALLLRIMKSKKLSRRQRLGIIIKAIKK